GRTCGSLSLIDLGVVSKPADPCFIYGLNFSIRREVFQKCDGFHPDCIPQPLQRYQGDGETGLSLKIKEQKLLAHYHPSVAVTHIIPATGWTPKAFEPRAFYQGVCDSYTRIRREGAPPPLIKSWKVAVRSLKRTIHRINLLVCDDAKAICKRMA